MNVADQDLQEIKQLLREMPGKVATSFGVLPGAKGLTPSTLPTPSGMPAPSSMPQALAQHLFPGVYRDASSIKKWLTPAPLPFAQPLPVATPFSGPAMNVGANFAPTVPNFGYLGPSPGQLPSGSQAANLPVPASSPVMGGKRFNAFSVGAGGDAGAGVQTIVEGLKTIVSKLNEVKEAVKEAEGGDPTTESESKVEPRSRKSIWQAGEPENKPETKEDRPPLGRSTRPPAILRPSLG
ncbi:MAG TPA: hypothetical protein VNX28_08720 [Gemmataceae bacterium]|jgi:hypothetical protein|nr:hypothetical protein [Gemmataceae bacterium]